jgi:hypothetical protein
MGNLFESMENLIKIKVREMGLKVWEIAFKVSVGPHLL